MKKLFTLIICLFGLYAHAQNQADKQISINSTGQKPITNNVQLSFGTGITVPNSAVKLANNMGIFTNFNVRMYIPLFQFGGATGGVISLGINAGGEYFRGNKAYDISSYKPLNIIGQNGIPTIIAKGTASPKQAGFKTEGGAQANFSFGSYSISPILNIAYLNLKQDVFNISQNSSVNGQSYEHALYTQEEGKTTGVAVVARLKHKYTFGRDNRFGIYAEANYVFGPTIKTQSSYLVPEGSANTQGNYNLNQLNFATKTVQSHSTKFNSFGVNAGFEITLGSLSNSSENKKSRRLKGKVIRMGDKGIVRNSSFGTETKVKCACGTDIYAKDEEACKRICQFLKDGTYSNLGIKPNIKSGENVTVKAQILSLPNNMGIGWQPLEQIKFSDNKTTYQDLTADEAKKIDQLAITYLLPSNVTVATTNLKNVGEENNQFDWYWKVYKSNKGDFVALPMPLMMSVEGLKNLSSTMRKNNNPTSNPTQQAPCKIIYRQLPYEVSYLPDMPMEEVFMKNCVDNLIFAPPADTSATHNLPNYPTKMVYNSDGTTIRISSNKLSKAQNLKQANFSSTYIEGYGMVIYPMDYGISNKEASTLIDGLFRGSKKNEALSKSSEGNNIKYVGSQNTSPTQNAKTQGNPCDPAIYDDGYVGDLTQTVYPITATSIHQGSIPVYLNPTNLNFQFNGYSGGVDVWIHKWSTAYNYFSPFTSIINLFISSSSSTTSHNVPVANFPPGKYNIMAEFGPEGSVKRNLCLPIFIIAKTLVNKTILPSCVYVGQTIPVTWTGGNGDANVNLVLRRQLNSVAYTPINISIPNTGSYNLVIPNTGFTVGETYSVEINDGNQYATSNYYNQANVFKICKKIGKDALPVKVQIKPQIDIKALDMDKCDCGTWETKQIKYSDVTKDINCGGEVGLGRNTNATFNLKYNCSSTEANCVAKYEVTVTKPNGSSTTTLITNNLNWNYLFNMAGNYALTFKVSCGDKVCTPCTYAVIVK